MFNACTYCRVRTKSLRRWTPLYTFCADKVSKHIKRQSVKTTAAVITCIWIPSTFKFSVLLPIIQIWITIILSVNSFCTNSILLQDLNWKATEWAIKKQLGTVLVCVHVIGFFKQLLLVERDLSLNTCHLTWISHTPDCYQTGTHTGTHTHSHISPQCVCGPNEASLELIFISGKKAALSVRNWTNPSSANRLQRAVGLSGEAGHFAWGSGIDLFFDLWPFTVWILHIHTQARTHTH